MCVVPWTREVSGHANGLCGGHRRSVASALCTPGSTAKSRGIGARTTTTTAVFRVRATPSHLCVRAKCGVVTGPSNQCYTLAPGGATGVLMGLWQNRKLGPSGERWGRTVRSCIRVRTAPMTSTRVRCVPRSRSTRGREGWRWVRRAVRRHGLRHGGVPVRHDGWRWVRVGQVRLEATGAWLRG